jgi:hypothetical protein
MFRKIITQIAIGVGVHVVNSKVLPKIAAKAKKKLNDMKEQKESEDAESTEPPTAKVYSTEWK